MSAFSIVELVYAAEKASNPFTADDLQIVIGALNDPTGPFEVIALDAAIGAQVARVPRSQNADPGDRLIVATAENLSVTLVSADRKIPTMTSLTVIA